MPVSMNNVAQVNNTQPINQQPKTTDEKTKSFSTKTAVVVGTGLAALAAVGIYLTTRKRMPTTNQAKMQDIIQEGVNNSGNKFKIIKDKATGKCKESITYYNNGKEHQHTWYNKDILKRIDYDENGDKEFLSIISSDDSGKKIKNIHYCSPEEKQKFGLNIQDGKKYYPNGKIRVLLHQVPNRSFGYAKLYDVDGNLVKERIFLTPFGKANGCKLEE